MRTDGKMILVVTGGIGSGKSLVCSMFHERGVPVYDSDSRTKSLYSSSPSLAGKIADAFGAGVLLPDGSVDRRKLASMVFGHDDRLSILEGIVHPEVREDFIRWRDGFCGSDVPFLIMESAIILEKPLFRDLIDRILLVDAPQSLRLSRAVARDGADAAGILARMSGQKLFNGIKEGREMPEADYVIENDGDIESLSGKVAEIYLDILSETGNRHVAEV